MSHHRFFNIVQHGLYPNSIRIRVRKRSERCNKIGMPSLHVVIEFHGEGLFAERTTLGRLRKKRNAEIEKSQQPSLAIALVSLEKPQVGRSEFFMENARYEGTIGSELSCFRRIERMNGYRSGENLRRSRVPKRYQGIVNASLVDPASK